MTENGFSYDDVPTRERKHHEKHDPHGQSSWLAEVILGGQDGLVNVLGVILGVAAATLDGRIILAAGMAAAFAESVSMAAVAYTSSRAEQDFHESERRRERRHIEKVPHLERAEVRELFARKGFDGDLLDRIVAQITADPEVWVRVMLHEEHGIFDGAGRHPVARGVLVGVAALVGSLLPLWPFAMLPVGLSIWLSLGVSAATLFVVGWYKARTTVGRPMRSGVEMLVIGMASAAIGYLVGLLFRAPAAAGG